MAKNKERGKVGRRSSSSGVRRGRTEQFVGQCVKAAEEEDKSDRTNEEERGGEDARWKLQRAVGAPVKL